MRAKIIAEGARAYKWSRTLGVSLIFFSHFVSPARCPGCPSSYAHAKETDGKVLERRLGTTGDLVGWLVI